MSYFNFMILFVTLFICNGAEANNSSNEDGLNFRILGGDNVEEGTSIPFIVAIWVGQEYACGGSIVAGSKRTIVTAAHCVVSRRAYELTIGVGGINIFNMMKYYVDSITIHPSYGYFQKNDIALIHLSEDLTFDDRVGSIQLDSNFVKENENVTFYGWGWSSYPIGMSSDDLKEIQMNTKSISTCKIYWFYSTNNNLCVTKVGPGNGGACRGDSGGPLVMNNKLIGVLSWGLTPCGTGYPDVFTRIDPYVNWINKNLQ